MKEKLRKNKKKIIVLLPMLLILCGIVVMGIRFLRIDSNDILLLEETKIAYLERRDLSNSISVSGKVIASDSKTVASDLTGVTVKTLNVQVGDKVRPGDVICIFDSNKIEKNLEDAQTNLTAAVSSQAVNVSAAERSLAEAEARRNTELEKADMSIGQAWGNYVKALEKLKNAENDYSKASGNEKGIGEQLESWKKKLETATEQKERYDSYSSQFNTALKDLESYKDLKNLSSLNLTNVQFDNAYLPETIAGLKSTIADTEVEVINRLDKLEEYWQLYYGEKGYIEGVNNYQKIGRDIAEAQEQVTDYEAEYTACESAKTAAEAAVEAAKESVDAALISYDSQVRAKQETIVSTDSNVASQTDNVKTAKIAENTTGISEKASIREYGKQLDDCVVTAPIGGTITSVSIQEGDNYTGAAIVQIEDESEYLVAAEINEYDILNVREGQRVLIRTKAMGETIFEGKVVKIAPKATESASAGSSVTYTVKMAFDSPDVKLKLGMTCILEIILNEETSVFAVPPTAIQTDEKGEHYIIVGDRILSGADAENTEADDRIVFLDEEGELVVMSSKKIYVSTGLETDYYIMISGADLKDNMIIAMSEDTEETMDPEEAVLGQGVMGGM